METSTSEDIPNTVDSSANTNKDNPEPVSEQTTSTEHVHVTLPITLDDDNDVTHKKDRLVEVPETTVKAKDKDGMQPKSDQSKFSSLILKKQNDFDNQSLSEEQSLSSTQLTADTTVAHIETGNLMI